MNPYSLPPYRPAYVPANGQPLAHRLGQSVVPESSGKTGTIMMGVAGTALGVATAVIGVRAGLKEKGFYSALGWLVGAGGVILGFVNIGSFAASVGGPVARAELPAGPVQSA